MFEVLEGLINTIRERKNSSSHESYTKKLLDDKNLCREKVMEEIKELIDALNQGSNQVHETADVIYHLLVLLEANDVKVEDVIVHEIDVDGGLRVPLGARVGAHVAERPGDVDRGPGQPRVPSRAAAKACHCQVACPYVSSIVLVVAA